jgi:predicted Rossmann-fold nucleotide-binding protein
VGFIAIRGGMGTVTEISLVWNKLQTGVLEPRPLVLLGDSWRKVVQAWKENLVVSEADISLLDFASSAEEACQIIITKTSAVRV